MQKRTSALTLTMLGLFAVSCGTTEQAAIFGPHEAQAALTMPFPDEYFGMFVARDAAARSELPEGCATAMEKYNQAWGGIQTTPEFKQVTDTAAWKKVVPVRDEYAASGCFTSGLTLSQPSADCKAPLTKLSIYWDEAERTPQFQVLIASAANHDVYASWVDAVALRCYLN